LTDDDKVAINQFSVLDFVKPHKKTQTKANTVFCPKTGLYRPPGAEVGQPAPRGRRTSSFFWDTRVGAWRLKQADVVHKEDAPCFFGKETQFPLTEISLTVSKHHGDVPNAWFIRLRDHLLESCERFVIGGERGDRNKNFHCQVVLVVRMSSDPCALSEFKKSIRNAVGANTGDGCQISTRIITELDGLKYMLGYVSKYRRFADYKEFSHGFSREEIEAGQEHHDARATSPMRKQRVINQNNAHTEAWAFYQKYFNPMVVPTFTWMLTAMLQSGEYIFGSMWAKMNVRYDQESAEALWSMMHCPGAVKPGDVSALMFGRGDPGDVEYDGVSFELAARRAQEVRADRAEAELEFGELAQVTISRTQPAARPDSEGYMAFNTPAVGTLANPRAPIRELSAQTRGLLARKRQRTLLHSDIGTPPLDDGEEDDSDEENPSGKRKRTLPDFDEEDDSDEEDPSGETGSD